LALGAFAPDRVTAIGLAASPGPRDLVPGALDELEPEYQAIVALLATDRPAGMAALRESCAWYAGDGWETMFAESWGAADDRLLARPDVLEPMKALIREGARQGTAGFEADEAASLTPWGFSVAEVGQPTYVWCAGSDVRVGQAHADYLAQTIPRATLVIFPDVGHLFPIVHWAEMLAAVN
jgi:pimeloyl-ACP methyl ester carboxylesterase